MTKPLYSSCDTNRQILNPCGEYLRAIDPDYAVPRYREGSLHPFHTLILIHTTHGTHKGKREGENTNSIDVNTNNSNPTTNTLALGLADIDVGDFDERADVPEREGGSD